MMIMEGDPVGIFTKKSAKILAITYTRTLYSRTSIIRTPVCQLNHKSVQISEFVRINEAHTFIYRALLKYSNRTYTYSNRTFT